MWKKDIAQWEIGKNLYLSVPFTWLMPKAREFAKQYKGKVFAGGPSWFHSMIFPFGKETAAVRLL